MENGSRRKFKIKTMDGRSTDFETDANISIEELKREVESKMNVPIHRQRLIYKSRLLKEDQRLSDYITKDDEVVHMMAMTEEQARSRSRDQQRESARPNVQPNLAAGPNIFGQIPGPGSTNASGDPFAGMFGMINNLMQGINPPGQGANPGAHAHISSGPIDISQLFGQNFAAQARAPASNDSGTQNNRANSRPGRQQPNPSVIISVSSRSASRNRDATRGAGAARVSEENKNERSNSGTRNSTRIALPHPHIYETNLISNELMGPGAAFPGPPLPPTGQPRNAQTILGSYLTSLQFAMSRMTPYVWRSGELLQREHNIANPLERAETQQLINQTGRAMEQLGRALILSSHYYRDLTLGEAPNDVRVSNNPHPDFAELTQRFTDASFPGSRSGGSSNSGASSGPSTRQSTFASQPSGSASNRSQAQAPQANPLGNIFQSILTPENLNNITGLLGNIGGGMGGAQGVRVGRQQPSSASSSSRPQPTSASNASGSQPQRDVHMASAEETKDSPDTHRTAEEEKKQAEQRQQTINSRFISDFSNVASHANNPLQQMFQSMMPVLSGAMGGDGANPLSRPLGDIFPEDSGVSRSFIMKVLVNSSIQDLLAVMNGNYEVVTTLHPRTRDILLSEYMSGQDTAESRDAATETIADELNSQMILPDDVAHHVPRGSDPLKTAKRINKTHIKKLIGAILDIEHNPQDSTIFLKRVKRILRWWVGEFIDGMKPHFNQQLPDVLKFIRGNIQHSISNIGDGSMQLIGGMFTDTIMKGISDAYNQYKNDKKREDEAEARELNITLDELYQRRRDSEMDVDHTEEDPKIEEENANNLQSNSSPNSHATASNATPAREEQKQSVPQREEEKVQPKAEEEKDPEIKALLDMMEEDQSMLVVDPPSKKPKSRAYRALDVYDQQNIESGNSITESTRSKKTPKEDATELFRSALKDYGFKGETIDKNLGECELTDEFIDHYKEVIRQEIRQRKNDPEYKEGQFPELDKV